MKGGRKMTTMRKIIMNMWENYNDSDNRNTNQPKTSNQECRKAIVSNINMNFRPMGIYEPEYCKVMLEIIKNIRNNFY